MKPGNLLVLAGGLLAAVAFFLPFFATGLSSGTSLLQVILQNMQPTGTTAVKLYLCEPAAAYLLLVGGVLGPRMRRMASAWSLSGATLGLSFLGWFLTGSSYPLSEASFREVVHLFDIGYWLAVIGCALGLLGALLNWREQRASTTQPQGAPAGGLVPLIRPGLLLVLCGGLAAVGGFFIAPFASGDTQSLFDLFKQLHGSYLLIWPEPLAALLLLLAAGFLALRGGKGAYLVSLSGTFVELPFLLFMLLVSGQGLFQFSLGPGFWLAAFGSFLGLMGAVLGLLARPAAPVFVGAGAAPRQYYASR